MYRTILVPLDGSKLAEAILVEIKELARALGARIVLLRVCRAHVFPGKDSTDAEVEVMRGAQTYLTRIQEELWAEGFEVESSVRYGDVAQEILNHSIRNDIDLIAMSTHGRTGVGRWLLGSVSEKIVRHSEKPVLLFRPRQAKPTMTEAV
ncbi:MAG: universal stress protein [Deltaproteobacteria bacterium]|nr:universal stress protein [Deltaproteobacteria bacterium]MBW2070446.1 universal stress protein [Deltaproteobacteria bacterium]